MDRINTQLGAVSGCCLTLCFMSLCTELRLMFSLMDRVPDGIDPMLHALEEHIVSAGLADMIAAADCITSVRRP